MKLLIVNADDFGLSPGLTDGILEAHRGGILTSTSMIVTSDQAEDAARLAARQPALSIGLHARLTSPGGRMAVDVDDPAACKAELHRQLERFVDLLGRLPTHLDSHHNVHRDSRLTPLFLETAQAYGLPLREHSSARHVSSFHGDTDVARISVEALTNILRTQIGDGVTELSCHPGHVDDALHSRYSVERETELRTLCDPRLPPLLVELGIQLIGFRDLTQ